MKTLIINGSPKKNGDTAALIKEFANNLDGEIKIISYFDDIAPCRASGTHTYRRMKDKEAGKCIYCEDYSKKIGCKHVYCPYILERAEMGSIDYA